MFNGPEIPMSIFFLAMAAIFVLRGPFGRALADRLAGRSGVDDREVRELRGEVDELRHQLTEVQERLDFAERLLAQQREADRLPGTR
ncbi:MAG TPA: hypothetical protein VGQ25_04610 [Gemmatimonadales bacterium]|nr:hypothetical protein [Gemmatimonadales bacterium]